MKHDNFERKKPINTPYLNRAKVILLKQAICQAENDVYELIYSGVDIVGINKALDNLKLAKEMVKSALNQGYLHDSKLHYIQVQLHRAVYHRYHESIWTALEMTLDLFEVMPEKPPVKYGIPYYRITEKGHEWFEVTVVNHNQPKNQAEAAMSLGGAK